MRTVWLEISHKFRCPPAVEKTPFGTLVRFAWLGVGVGKTGITEFIEAWHKVLRDALRRAGEE